MYEVYGGVKSRTFRVLWMLEELGQAYTHHPEPPRSDAVRALNASGKIPVLVENGAVLTDSTAILTYLTDKHGALTHPPGTHARARQDALTHFILDEMDALLWMAARHSFVLPQDRRVPTIKESLRWEFETSVARLVARLGDGPFLMGAAMTVPDILAAHCGNWAAGAKFPAEDPAFQAYLARMRARPAFRRVAELGAAKAG